MGAGSARMKHGPPVLAYELRFSVIFLILDMMVGSMGEEDGTEFFRTKYGKWEPHLLVSPSLLQGPDDLPSWPFL